MKILNQTFNLLCKLQIKNPSCILKQYCIELKSVSSVVNFTCFSSLRCMTVNSSNSTSNALRNGGKCFRETENEYAHKVMENLPNYSSSLLIHPLLLRKYRGGTELSENSSAVQTFINISTDNLSQGLCLENEKFKDVILNVCYSLSQASDEEIKMVLHYLCLWPPTPSTVTPNFRILWNTLDKECVKRIKRWNVSHQLLIADYWFHLRLSRICRYNQEVIYNLISSVDSLSNHHLVQLMFFVNLQRNVPSSFMSNLEKKLESVIHCLSVEELGIICLGFFKTQNKIIDSKLIQTVIKKFMHNVENVDTVTVVAVLKFLRKSLNRSFIDLYILLLHKCINCVDKWDIPTSIHLALLSSECNVYHPLLLNTVSEKVTDRIIDARIKDCTKLLVSLSMFNHTQKNFYDLFILELQKKERQNEINQYPVHIVHAAMYLAYAGYYNYELLSRIFDNQFFNETSLKYPDTCSVFAELDCCVEIECEDYQGPKLDWSVRKVLQTYRGNLPSQSQKLNMQTRLLKDVYECLLEIFGDEKNILIRHILPHMYSPDIIVRLSELENESLADLYNNYSPDQILKPPSNETWASLVIAGMYSFAHRSTQMTGITAMKLRQLKKIGYEVLFLPYFNISQNKSRRKIFLEEKLEDLQKNIKKPFVLCD